MIYQWRNHESKVSAQVVGETMERLETEYGIVHPRLLVEAAQSISSPLHELFEWDDPTAASAYRVDQARGVLQAIRVVFTPGEEPTPAFVHVRTLEGGPGYTSIVRAMSDEVMRAQVLAEALTQLEALRKRFETLSELQPVWEAVLATGRGRRPRNVPQTVTRLQRVVG